VCVCVCCEVPGRKRKNRKGVENKWSVSPAVADDAVSSDVMSSSSVVSCDMSMSLSSADSVCSESSSSSDVTSSASNTTVVCADTVSEEVADSSVETTSAVCDRNNNATSENCHCYCSPV